VKRRVAYKILNDPDRYTDRQIAKARQVCGLREMHGRISPALFAAISEWFAVVSEVLPKSPAWSFSTQTYVINNSELINTHSVSPIEDENARNS
jgi:hypothetical protein